MRKTSVAIVLAFILGCGVATVAPLDASAIGVQQSVSETRRASRRPDIEIFNRAGSVRIVGWDRREVQVNGTLGRGAEGLEVESDGDDVYIGVHLHGRRDPGGMELEHQHGSELEIRVPRGASIEVDTMTASVEITGVEGEVTVATVSGRVEVTGGPRELDVETGSGDISAQLTSSVLEVDLISGSGLVDLRAEAAEVSVETVSGSIDIVGANLRDSSFDSTAGSIRFTGDLSGSRSYEFESFNGNITLILSPEVSATFEASTHAGGIENDFGFEPRPSGRAPVGLSLEFEVGGGEAEVSIDTFSGTIEIRKR
jgi:DUF4097 and DUF4098 domain-containing protein YvlB